MHRNARLTPQGRLLLCQRIEGGWPVPMRQRPWGSRGPTSGGAAIGRRAQPDSRIARLGEAVPHQNQGSIERRVVTLRQKRGLGPARIAGICGLQASTVHRVAGAPRAEPARHLDKMTRAPIRRYEMNARASSSTSTSRSWAASPREGAGGSRAGKNARAPKEHGRLRLRPHRHRRYSRLATPRCWPTSRR